MGMKHLIRIGGRARLTDEGSANGCSCHYWRLKFLASSGERREPRHAAVGQFLVFEQDSGADGGGIFTFLVGKPGADGELDAVGQLHEQCAEAALVTAG